MGFLEIYAAWEDALKNDFLIELLEMSYSPYSFGSGECSYLIRGTNVNLAFDGRDRILQVFVSKKHARYPNCSWTIIFDGKPKIFFDTEISKLKKNLIDGNV